MEIPLVDPASSSQIFADADRAARGRGASLRTSSSELASVALRTDREHSFPVERLHGFVDALIPIVATVLFAKNFSEIGEAEAELMEEKCLEEDVMLADAEEDEDGHWECTWFEVAKLMWIGLYAHERFSRLASTCVVFALVYADWLNNVRIFRGIKSVSKIVIVLQMVWCIGTTVYPLTLSPWMMGWNQPLAMNLALGQLAACQVFHLVLVSLLPMPQGSRRMVQVEDTIMLVGLAFIALVVALVGSADGDPAAVHHANKPSFYWTLFVILHGCRVLVQKKLSAERGWPIPPWICNLERLEVRFWTEIPDDFRRFVDEIWRF